MATAGTNGGSVSIVLNNGAGVFSPPTTISNVGNHPLSIAAGNFNNDSNGDDLVITNTGTDIAPATACKCW